MKKTVCIIAVLLAASTLQSEIIEQTKTFSGTPSYASELIFNKFDTHGGAWTLTGVNVLIYLSTEAQGYIGIDNDGAMPASGTVTMGSKLTVTASKPMLYNVNDDGLSSISAVSSTNMTLAAEDDDGTTFSTVGSDYGYLLVSATEQSESMDIGSDYWSKYAADGGGTYSFTAAIDQIASYSSLGGVQVQIDPMFSSGHVVVTYEYTTPIPEPATLSMAAVALAVAVWFRRRFAD